MFKGNMKEASNATLELSDATCESVEAMLAFVYTDNLDPRLALDVLPLAHRYQLDRLTSQCCEQILGSVNATNVVLAIRMLLRLREDTAIAETWETLVEKVRV